MQRGQPSLVAEVTQCLRSGNSETKHRFILLTEDILKDLDPSALHLNAEGRSVGRFQHS